MSSALLLAILVLFGTAAYAVGAPGRVSLTNTWALWDAEGQHLTTEEILDIRRDFSAGVYFFRSETKHDLDLQRLIQAGVTTVKVAHPGYAPFNQPDFMSDEARVREWARNAAGNPFVDGLALDIEGPTATTHKHLLRWLSEEAHARGKSLHAIPHFALFDRWEDTLTPEEINTYADVVWPWLYNRFRQEDYASGLAAMLEYWRDHGVTTPLFPIFDHGRTDYSGITPAEAAQVLARLQALGVETLCLFQPHLSYRARADVPEYGTLWEGLAGFASEKPLLRAFPGAEGFGACTSGGRGGRILFVTTLDDYVPGSEEPIPGSLRAAVMAEGPRYVLFRVGGTIALKADLWIRNPHITIAGQTAPGGGICIKDYQVVLATREIIVRHVRFRSGDETRKEQMSVGIFGGHDSIIDHCSMTWAIDEVMSSFGTVHNLTVQWSIISEGLSRSYHPKGEHSKGSILGGDGGITIHHCIYAHNSARNPRVNTIVLDFRNNLLYNWGYRAGYTREGPCYMNYVGNYLMPGPSTRSSAVTDLFQPGDDMARIFLADNLLIGYPEQTQDNRLLIDPPKGADRDAFRETVTVNEPFRSPGVQTHAPRAAFERILAEAGALLPIRDSADQRLMEEIRTGTGRIIDSQQDVGGWPVLADGHPEPDADADGMPDQWERQHKLAFADAADALEDPDHDGYPNIEEFLNATDPHKPEQNCRVDATRFTAIQREAIDLADRGEAEFMARREEEAARQEELRDAALEALEIEVIPKEGSKGTRLLVRLGEKAAIEFVGIPAGSFLMGSPESEGGLPDERPQHKVNISKPFFVAATLTTNAQLVAILGATERRTRPGEEDFPAHEVSWFEAVKYCELLSAKTGRKIRLPTEAEWEYTCRAGTTTAFHTGDTITTDLANFDGEESTRFNPPGEYRGKKVSVASFPPNAWGLYDTHGNQAEYCLDYCYRTYTADEVTDPVGPATGGARVLRSGRAKSKAFYIRSAYRYGYAPAIGYGFRMVMEAGN
jgi:formylglycine-generating enzyme required for sulfatase activity/pectate lyase